MSYLRVRRPEGWAGCPHASACELSLCSAAEYMVQVKTSSRKAGSKFGFGNGECALNITEKSEALAHPSEVMMT